MSLPRLNRQLVLETAQRIPDGAGGFRASWVPLGVLWAEVTAGSGREGLDGGATVSSVPYKIIVRAAPATSPQRPHADQRFTDGKRAFNIRSVAEHDLDGSYLLCLATEEVVV